MSDYVFLADSTTLPRHLLEDVTDMVAEAAEISMDDFRDVVGPGAYQGVEHALGYDEGSPLEDDGLVTAYRGSLRDTPAVFLERSGIEYVYVPQKERKALLRPPRQGL